MKPELKEGWQCKVLIYKDYVIKIPKTKREITDIIRKHLEKFGDIRDLKERVKKVHGDIEKSIKIIKKSKIPKNLLANPEFLKNGTIKQKKVIVLIDKLSKLAKNDKVEETNEIIRKAVLFYIELWKYGINEKTLKLSNLGYHKGKIVLLDFLEITDDKNKISKRLKKKPLINIKHQKNRVPTSILNYFLIELKKNLTVKNLNKYWNKNN